jgi:LemA protein
MQTLFSRFGTLFVVLGIVIVLGLWAMSSYNSLVAMNETVNTQWAQVETQYQRRFDLIPNLVASVQGSMKQEQAIFTKISEDRKGYAGARTVDEKAVAAGNLESSLGRLLMITENYPVLKSNDNVQNLMSQLEGTENRVSVERMRYNDIVKTYNIKVKSFPGSLFAKMFGFGEKKMFEAETGAASAPKVQL